MKKYIFPVILVLLSLSFLSIFIYPYGLFRTLYSLIYHKIDLLFLLSLIPIFFALILSIKNRSKPDKSIDDTRLKRSTFFFFFLLFFWFLSEPIAMLHPLGGHGYPFGIYSIIKTFTVFEWLFLLILVFGLVNLFLSIRARIFRFKKARLFISMFAVSILLFIFGLVIHQGREITFQEKIQGVLDRENYLIILGQHTYGLPGENAPNIIFD